jgi:two-component system, LytTR family, sensor kinase
MQKAKVILIHLVAWTVYFLTQIFGTTKLDENFWINFVCTNLPVLVLFYSLTRLIFPYFLKKGIYGLLVLLTIALILLSVALRFILAMLILRGNLNDLIDAAVTPMFWSQLRISLLFTGISFAVWYAKRNFEMIKNQQLLEKEVADAQLLTLKNQINPHFLYNTLSFLYTKSLPLSKELSDAIAALSEMMRYSLGEGGEDGMVNLQKEVAHLKNFINIHQLRYSNNLHVQFNAEGDIERHKIIPLLLITFVENAFKHGKVNDKKYPLSINLHANNTTMQFRVTNRKSSGLKEKSSGVGLQNIKNRLELAYPEKHVLRIDDNHEFYSIDLTIQT